MTKAKAKKNTAQEMIAKADAELAAAEEPSFESMVEGGEMHTEERTDSAQTALANYTSEPSFDQDDVVIPRLRLAQGLTTEVQDGLAKPGQWLLIGYEPEEELTIVPLAFTKRRELRDEDTRELLCVSKDARNGEGAPGGICGSCSMAEWVRASEGGRNTPPACSFQYAYLVYVVELDSMAALTFAKTGLSSGKLLNTIVAQRGMGKCAVKLANSQRKGPKGNYYVPAVHPTNVEAGVLDMARAKASGDVVV